MECSESKELITLYLGGELEQPKQRLLENHLKSCHMCQKEYAATKKLWDLMGEVRIPEPSYAMQTEFNAVLRNFKAEQSSQRNYFSDWLEKLRDQWLFQLKPHLALSLVMIAVGFIIGLLLNRPVRTEVAYHRQIDSLSTQVMEMKQVMMLTLLQDPSASQRMRAVSYTEEIEEVDSKVIDALFTTLNSDPNVNVRLVTLDALVKYSDDSRVREGLVQSLGKQESPLMQSAIADIMVQLHEKRSVKTMKELLRQKELNERVKVKFKESINKLI